MFLPMIMDSILCIRLFDSKFRFSSVLQCLRFRCSSVLYIIIIISLHDFSSVGNHIENLECRLSGKGLRSIGYDLVLSANLVF